MRVIRLKAFNASLTIRNVELIAEIQLGSQAVVKVRRKGLLQLVGSKQKDAILLDAEAKINDVISNIFSDNKYSELDGKKCCCQLDIRAERRNHQYWRSKSSKKSETSMVIDVNEKLEAASRRRRLLQVDSESDSNNEEDVDDGQPGTAKSLVQDIT
jgi:hypothetical protein